MKRIATLFLAVTVVAGACGSGSDSAASGATDERIDRLEESVSSLQAEVADLHLVVDELVPDPSSQVAQAPTIETTPPAVSESDLLDLQIQLDALSDVFWGLEGAVGDLRDEHGGLVDCVNDYMEVIGVWSTNTGAYFDWWFC